ncbi:MAG TPA: hypothetical protein VH280_18355 [Verrucomicrobiae bacterium]|nr:hypothetical protein [Verrucomicrobiae bacterium]
MRVIIQDLETKAYLSESGRWVLNKADARDFETLLRAYLFAEKNTSCKFEVLLHCLDDGYTSGIIKGVGTAVEKIPAVVESDATETVWHREMFLENRRGGLIWILSTRRIIT